jgi:RimJ/RimL family protein N-acetyltransferase
VTRPRLTISEIEEQDLPFLFELWRIAQVMRYADELPAYRGWTRTDDAGKAWAIYRERRKALGTGYTQLVLRLADGTPVGESFFAPLPEGFTLDAWSKPKGKLCLMGDIKLKPGYWNKGLGTEGMRQVVEWLFANTDCALLAVPPHFDNPAAVRVYEKAGFIHTDPSPSWKGHRIMELSRERFELIR